MAPHVRPFLLQGDSSQGNKTEPGTQVSPKGRGEGAVWSMCCSSWCPSTTSILQEFRTLGVNLNFAISDSVTLNTLTP